MKKLYYVNKTAQENSLHHEVHEDGCTWLEIALDTEYLGLFDDCHGAVAHAKANGYPKANGCKICSFDCDTDHGR